LSTPKKCKTAQGENLIKSRKDFESKLNVNNDLIYDFENNNLDDNENANNEFNYKPIKSIYNNNAIIKKSNINRNKEISTESCKFSNNENTENLKLLENYQNNKSDKNNKQGNIFDNNFLNKQNKNSNIKTLLEKNLKKEKNGKIKYETNNILLNVNNKNKKQENKTQIKNEEKAFFTEADAAKIEKLFINKILKIRSDSLNKIIFNYRIYKKAQLQKEENFIEEILSTRKYASIRIQSAFRSFHIRRNIRIILNKLEENYIFLYDYNKKYFQNSKGKSSSRNAFQDFEEEPNHDIKLQLLGSGKKPKNCEVLNFEYSKFLKSYMLVFKKKGLIRRNYKINFIVNGNIIIDPRFKLDAGEDGKFYNVIESHMLLIKNKIKSYENKLRYHTVHNRGSSDNSSVSTNFISSNNSKTFYSESKNNEKDNKANKKNFCEIYKNENNNNSNTNNTNLNLNLSLQESKYWEDIFKIKVFNNYRSVNTNSVSDASDSRDVDRIFTMKSFSKAASSRKSKAPETMSSVKIKPCLKKQSSTEGFGPIKKSVSFNENIQISFFSV